MLQALTVTATFSPAWAHTFCKWISEQHQVPPWHNGIMAILQAIGYIGAQTVIGLDSNRLIVALLSLSASETGVPLGQGMAPSAAWIGAATCQYSTAFPADMKRAGLEIYRALRAEGVASVR